MAEYNRSARRNIIVVLLFLGLGLLTSCEEKISGIGYNLLRDTVAVETTTLADSGILTSHQLLKQDVNASGVTFTLNYSSPYLFIGNVPAENLESWVVIKAPLLSDTVGVVSSVELKLPMRTNFLYGDASNDSISFAVYLETLGKVTDSTRSLTLSDLSPTPVGYGYANVAEDSVGTITVKIDSALIAPHVHTASLAFVLVPNQSMKSIRGLSSSDVTDINYHPQIHYITIKNGDTTEKYYDPKYDYHLVTDAGATSPGTFRLRGSAAMRHRFILDMKAIRAKLDLDPYATFNNGLLQLYLEQTGTTSSVTPTDTLGAILAEIGSPSVTDSNVILRSYGFKDASNSNLYNFQIREVIEKALRNGQDSVVLELRTGYAQRAFTGVIVYVEDYHLNKWTFYDVTATEPDKRPKLVLTYSYLSK